MVLDATIANIALPSAQRDLGFTDDSRQWIITAHSLASGRLLLLGGRTGDLFGRRKVVLTITLGLVGVVHGFSNAEVNGWSDPVTVATAAHTPLPPPPTPRPPSPSGKR